VCACAGVCQCVRECVRVCGCAQAGGGECLARFRV
jgi:hypothetical protein